MTGLEPESIRICQDAGCWPFRGRLPPRRSGRRGASERAWRHSSRGQAGPDTSARFSGAPDISLVAAEASRRRTPGSSSAREPRRLLRATTGRRRGAGRRRNRPARARVCRGDRSRAHAAVRPRRHAPSRGPTSDSERCGCMEYEVIATLGPNSDGESTWQAMCDVGVTGFRLNTSTCLSRS